MPSVFLFILATLFLSLNFVRFFGLAISDWLYFGAMGLTLAETFSLERHHMPCWWRNRFLWPVSLVLFGAVVSTMNSRNAGFALVEIFQQLFVITLFVSLVWIMVRRGKTTPILLAFILSGVFTAGVALVDYWSGSRYGVTLSGMRNVFIIERYFGALGHPNKQGYFLVLTTLLSLGQLLAQKPIRMAFISHLIWYVLIAIQLFGIYLSGSLTAYLGLFLGVIVFALSSKYMFFKAVRIVGVAIGAGAFLVLFNLLLNLTIFGRMPNLNDTSLVKAFNRVQTITAQTRLDGYDQAWVKIIQNPWLGVGYDQISTSGASVEERLLDKSVHNLLLQIWYTGGVFAFLGWLSIYVSIGWMALTTISRWKKYGFSPMLLALAAVAAAFLLMDQFQDAIYQREKWLVIGLLAGFSWEKVDNIIRQVIPDRTNR